LGTVKGPWGDYNGREEVIPAKGYSFVREKKMGEHFAAGSERENMKGRKKSPERKGESEIEKGSLP